MVQTISAKDISLAQLERIYNLELVSELDFFREWEENLPEITAIEIQRLDRVKASYTYLLKYPPLLENTVKMVVLSPLLDLAGFYLSPFRIKSEESITLVSEDENMIVKGQIDVLVISEALWVVVIESKKAEFSLEAGRPQLLTYMLANPCQDKPTYGLLTNGGSFRFLKLIKTQDSAKYAVSRIFDLFNPGNELIEVLKVLKNLANLSVYD
ncbi:protein of unknown function DUF450 [Gloeothece citriformis PCC 7424]|uniref:Uncharacterized protein n=1 Tax=Gloeothece citriformis (strain PCC 7424) TaxID=65393 RepID=B7KGC7_GLOC7|nr:hypothetical protein [Gloeothece citriformis]ACK70598.1 protein of unknown function DUF450 [Gloeothece citriformis PCC 7424]